MADADELNENLATLKKRAETAGGGAKRVLEGIDMSQKYYNTILEIFGKNPRGVLVVDQVTQVETWLKNNLPNGTCAKVVYDKGPQDSSGNPLYLTKVRVEGPTYAELPALTVDSDWTSDTTHGMRIIWSENHNFRQQCDAARKIQGDPAKVNELSIRASNAAGWYQVVQPCTPEQAAARANDMLKALMLQSDYDNPTGAAHPPPLTELPGDQHAADPLSIDPGTLADANAVANRDFGDPDDRPDVPPLVDPVPSDPTTGIASVTDGETPPDVDAAVLALVQRYDRARANFYIAIANMIRAALRGIGRPSKAPPSISGTSANGLNFTVDRGVFFRDTDGGWVVRGTLTIHNPTATTVTISRPDEFAAPGLYPSGKDIFKEPVSLAPGASFVGDIQFWADPNANTPQPCDLTFTYTPRSTGTAAFSASVAIVYCAAAPAASKAPSAPIWTLPVELSKEALMWTDIGGVPRASIQITIHNPSDVPVEAPLVFCRGYWNGGYTGNIMDRLSGDTSFELFTEIAPRKQIRGNVTFAFVTPNGTSVSQISTVLVQYGPPGAVTFTASLPAVDAKTSPNGPAFDNKLPDAPS